MVNLKVTRHLNGVIKFFIIEECGEQFIINMDKVSILSFEEGECGYCLSVLVDSEEKVFVFQSEKSYEEARKFINSELLRP